MRNIKRRREVSIGKRQTAPSQLHIPLEGMAGVFSLQQPVPMSGQLPWCSLLTIYSSLLGVESKWSVNTCGTVCYGTAEKGEEE